MTMGTPVRQMKDFKFIFEWTIVSLLPCMWISMCTVIATNGLLTTTKENKLDQLGSLDDGKKNQSNCVFHEIAQMLNQLAL